MKLGAMLGDILRSLFKKPVTERYPFERRPAPERLRGKLSWDPSKCTGCRLCAMDCPSNALDVIILDRAAKKFVMRYNVDRCTYCAQCVQNCRFDCLSLASDQWELAGFQKEPFTLYYGNEADIQSILAPKVDQCPDAPAAS